jgi:nitrogen fixation/metabolism regulation signal transduction histidine kinase
MYRILSSLLAIVILSIVSWQAFREGNYLGGALAAAGIIGLTGLIFYFINTTNRKLTYFFSALENDDYTIRFVENEGMQSERLLNHILNRIKSIIQNTRIEIQQKERYYELILNSISSGVIALDDNGFVLQLNRFALKLIDLEVFTHVSQLRKVSPVLAEAFKEIRPGENRRVTYTNERGSIQLLITASGITVNGKHTRLLVINDIENEMDEKEIDSWIRLIRVLAHEIMNSIAPITSLSDTLLEIHKTNPAAHTPETIRQNTINGLQVISETGKGLVSFVESYRKFTRIPQPEKEIIELNEFIQRMIILCSMEPNFSAITIQTQLTPENIRVYADPNLLGQVMLNLMKNAIQALQNRENPILRVVAEQLPTGNIRLQVIDNGPGIPSDMINEIFVPFFTTKNEGTGIGLSIARQIMRAHGGNLKVSSIPDKETVFTLVL